MDEVLFPRAQYGSTNLLMEEKSFSWQDWLKRLDIHTLAPGLFRSVGCQIHSASWWETPIVVQGSVRMVSAICTSVGVSNAEVISSKIRMTGLFQKCSRYGNLLTYPHRTMLHPCCPICCWIPQEDWSINAP